MFHVLLQRYSLAQGEVGAPIGNPILFSQHRSKAAAGRMLGSMISGKRRREVADLRHQVPSCDFQYVVHDTETGRYLARSECKA